MAKSINPRRQALKILRAAGADIRAMVSVWDQMQTVYEPSNEARYHGTWRPRRYSEKAENQPASWAQLARYADALAKGCAQLAIFARQQERAAQQRLDGKDST